MERREIHRASIVLGGLGFSSTWRENAAENKSRLSRSPFKTPVKERRQQRRFLQRQSVTRAPFDGAASEPARQAVKFRNLSLSDPSLTQMRPIVRLANCQPTFVGTKFMV
jgi:hypothetical protein